MKALAAALFVVCAAGGDLLAHRLDEYLQATRVSFARDRLTIDVDVTAGVSIASDVIAMIDANGDGAIEPAEGEAYGRTVLSDLLVTLDGTRVAMSLERADLPTIDEMRTGVGTVRLRAAGSVATHAGRHHLRFVNNHRPATSVYMVNALVPEDKGLQVVSQSRDARQREFHVEYTAATAWMVYLLWFGLGAAGLAVVAAGTRGSEKRAANDEWR